VGERVLPFYRALFRDSSQRVSMASWMSKAYAYLYQVTERREYADFVLEINDHLLHHQVQPGARQIDTIGSFFVGGSACGAAVFLEAVAEGLRVAQMAKDQERTRAYERSLLLGMRFLLQCQLTADEVMDAPLAEEQIGGLKSSVSDATLQIDTQQHAATAMLKTLLYVGMRY
jgi:hypothetical protein